MNKKTTTKLLKSSALAIFAAGLLAAPASAAEGTVNGDIAYLEGITTDSKGLNARYLEGVPDIVTLAEYSPDGSQLAYAARDIKGHGGLYVSDPDGTDRKRITANNATIRAAHWTEDGSRLIYLADRDKSGPAEVYSVAADGTGEVKLADDATDLTQERDDGFDPVESPSFSVGGGHIAYPTAGDGADSEIVVMNLDGTNKVPLTNDDKNDLQPVISPDGSKVLFTKLASPDEAQIMRIGVDGSGLSALTAPGKFSTSALISPDGSRIAYDQDATIRTMNADGTGDAELVPASTGGFVSGFSPDSTRVVYDYVNYGKEAYIHISSFSILFDGTGKKRLGGRQFADWQALDAPAPKPALELELKPGRVSSKFVPQARVECSNECEVKLSVKGKLGGKKVKNKTTDKLVGNSSDRIDVIDEKKFRKLYRGKKGTLKVKVTAVDAYGQKDSATIKLKVR